MEIKNTQEIYNEYYANILIPYITRKISIYTLPFDEKAYQILFRFNITTLYDFLNYIEKPDYSIMRKLLEKSFDRETISDAIEKALRYKKMIGKQFHTKTAPEIMEKYDGVLRVMDTLPVTICGNERKFELLQLETLGDLHRTLLLGNKECEIEFVDNCNLRGQYQSIYEEILDAKEIGKLEDEISHDIMASYSYQKKRKE